MFTNEKGLNGEKGTDILIGNLHVPPASPDEISGAARLTDAPAHRGTTMTKQDTARKMATYEYRA